jgi:hypothetical protein
MTGFPGVVASVALEKESLSRRGRGAFGGFRPCDILNAFLRKLCWCSLGAPDGIFGNGCPDRFWRPINDLNQMRN